MKKIAVLGANESIVTVLLRLINAYENLEAVRAEEAVKDSIPVDVLLLSSGNNPEIEHSAIAALKKLSPEMPVVQHYGGGSGLLRAELIEAFNGVLP